MNSFKDGGTIVSMVADDMEWRTSGFDLAILDMINKIKGIGIVYCNDDYIQGKKLCVNLFTTRKYIEATRHPFMCEKFQSYFIDTVHMRIASKIKKAYYLKDVILKHHHYSAAISFTGTEPGGKHLAIHAPELALKPRL